MDRAGTKLPPSPFEVMMQSMNEDKANTGMSCHVKRKLPDGTMVDADPKALGSLGTKSRMMYAANNLKQMSPSERTTWALEMKEYANALYAEQSIPEAMEKYVEALAASNFGTIMTPKVDPPKEEAAAEAVVEADAGTADLDLTGGKDSKFSDNNVDTLIVPVLCNLAACCIQIKSFAKAMKFADAALELRPRCGKALMRRGMALVHAGENKKAIHALQVALEVVDGVIEVDASSEGVDVSDLRLQPCMAISDTDRLRIPVLIERAQKLQEKHEKQKTNQLKQMQKVFGTDADSRTSAAATPSASAAPAGPGPQVAAAVQSGDVGTASWVFSCLAVVLAILYIFL